MRIWVVSLSQIELSPDPLSPLTYTGVFGVYLNDDAYAPTSMQCSTPPD